MRNTTVLTVSQLNEYIKAILDSNELLCDVCIKGEISNFTNHYKSGHLYFSLKDSDGVLKAVMFRSSAARLRFVPENGMKVLVSGRISAYPRDGVYQLYADSMQPDGVGSLYIAFEQLKEKLYTEGLFDAAHKKPIPRFPRSVGIITAETGAAVADMKNIISRRFPLAELWIYPSLVQGLSAPTELCDGVRYFNRRHNVDVIIIGRGGGSMEDLWAFNSELLAREIYASNIPIISAVGHETDFTICDFVADLRAPTPSAAAELAVPDTQTLLESLARSRVNYRSLLSARTEAMRERFDSLRQSPAFAEPQRMITARRETLSSARTLLDGKIAECLSASRRELEHRVARLEALSPLGVLSRGYTLVEDEKGGAIVSAKKIKPGDNLQIRFSDGTVNAVASDTSEQEVSEHAD